MSSEESARPSIIQQAVENNDPQLAQEALLEIESMLASSRDEEQKIYLLCSRANCNLVLENFDDAQRSLDVALNARPDESKQNGLRLDASRHGPAERKLCGRVREI